MTAPPRLPAGVLRSAPVALPAEKILLAGPPEAEVGGEPFLDWYVGWIVAAANSRQFLPNRRNGRGNYGFFDGHVKALRVELTEPGSPELVMFDVYRG